MSYTIAEIEDCVPSAGLSLRVREMAWDSGTGAKIHRFMVKVECIHCYAFHEDLLDTYGLSVAEMTRRILE